MMKLAATQSWSAPRQGAPAGRRAQRTVLIGWELGGGLGHVQRLGRLGRELAAHGHRPVFAVKNLVEPWPLLRDLPFPVVQAPICPPRNCGDRPFLAASFADILAARGFGSVADLAPLVEGWQRLIDLVRPSLVVCDHSPTLCLAAYRTLPVVLLGSGFNVPPAEGTVFPSLGSGGTPLVSPEQLLANIQEVQRRRGRPAPATLPGLFTDAERFVTVLPELDPYEVLRREPHVGPLVPLPAPAPPPDRPRFFAYLNASAPGVEQVLTLLARAGHPGTAYVRGASTALRDGLRGQGLEVLDEPPPLANVLPRVGAVVHHGGVGTAELALAAGRPQLLFPEHLEHLLNAQKLHGLGVAHYLVGQFPTADVARGLDELLSPGRFRERARAAAESIRARGPWQPLPKILGRCLALLA